MNLHPQTQQTPLTPLTLLNSELDPHAAVVDVPADATWTTATVADIHADHVIRHLGTGQPVAVIAWRNVELPGPLGPDPWWRRPHIPGRELTLAPAGMYADLIEITLPSSTPVPRLGRLLWDPPRLDFVPEPSTPDPQAPDPTPPHRPTRPVPARAPNSQALNGALAQRRTAPQAGQSVGPGMSR